MLPQIQLTANFSIPTYFLWISLVCCLLLVLSVRSARELNFPIKTALDLTIIIMVSGFIGGRLLHVIWEEPQIYINDPARIFKFWLGGFVFYGGFLLACAASAVYLKKINEPFLKWADFLAPLLALGYGLGRGSCLLAGCCYGSTCDLPWAVNFGDGLLRHPTQAYALIWELLVFAILVKFQKKWLSHSGKLFGFWILMHGFGRLFMEGLRDDFRGFMPLGVSISSWISFALILLGAQLVRRTFLAK